MTQLTVATWNLHIAQDEDRVRHQFALLRTLDLDAIAALECKHWERDGGRLLHAAEQELGLRGYLARSSSDGCHLALFVREPVIQVVRKRHRSGPPYWHGLARLEVRVEGFPEHVDLVGFHLAPSSPDIRLTEAETWQLLQTRPTIAAGDGNAVPAAGPLPPIPDEWDEEAKEHARRKRDRRAAHTIEAVGFVDTGEVCGDDTPTVGYTRADRLAYRCDRIYPRLPGGRDAVIAHKVITGWENLSDHRPVVAVLDLAAGLGL